MKNNDELDIKAKEMFDKGISLTKIARELGMCRGKMTERLRNKFNICVIPDGRKYRCNHDSFAKIDNESSAYWLGFIMADGCVRNDRNIIDVGLAEKDYNHLEKLNSFLSSDYKITKRVTKLKDKEFTSYRTYFVSKKIVLDLAKYGCVENKTYKISQIPRFNDYDLDRSYIRGFFDGDGSISTIRNSPRISKLTITSRTPEMLKDIIEVITEYTGNLEYSIYKRSEGSYSVQFKMDSVRRILFFMYHDSSIYLDRKYHIYKAYAVHMGNFVDYEWAKSAKSFMVDNAEESDSASVESRG